jgi:hypothetical protein
MRRTVISGEVSLDFTAAMMRERSATVNVSAMTAHASNLGAKRVSGMIPAIAVPLTGVSQMDVEKWLELEEDFRTWSGGFPPESEDQVIVYMDYRNPFQERVDEAREYLMDWCERGDPDFEETFRRELFGER